MILLARNTRLIRSAKFSSSSKQEVQEVIKGFVIPPTRVFGDVVIPAVKTLFASSKESRNKFYDMVNKGVINIDLLGIPMALALFHGLNSPLMEKYNFSPLEFGKGAKVALQQYCHAIIDLEETIFQWAERQSLSKKGNIDSGAIMEMIREELKNDPYSPVASIEQMLTPECFQKICNKICNSKTFFFQVRHININDWRTEISSVSLV